MGRGGASRRGPKNTQEVEAEKQKDKKRGQQDDKAQPPKSPSHTLPSSVSLRQGVANLWPESQPPTLCAKR
jgi:hypothetical protein